MKHFAAEYYNEMFYPEGKPKCRGCRRSNLAHIVADYGGELREEWECMDCGTITSVHFNQADDRPPKKKMRIRSRFSKENKDGRSAKNRNGRSDKGKRDRR